MDPIDKILIRTGILILGSIFGWTAVNNSSSLDTVAKAVQSQRSYNAGPVPLPERQK